MYGKGLEGAGGGWGCTTGQMWGVGCGSERGGCMGRD